MFNESEVAARQLLQDQPELAFFYIIYREYSTGSVADSTFYALATEPQSCEATMQRLCAEQKAKFDEERLSNFYFHSTALRNLSYT